jgi:hypothetical protein
MSFPEFFRKATGQQPYPYQQRLAGRSAKLPGRNPPRVAVDQGPRWLAALCIPLTFAESGRMLRILDLSPESELDHVPPTKLNA